VLRFSAAPREQNMFSWTAAASSCANAQAPEPEASANCYPWSQPIVQQGPKRSLNGAGVVGCDTSLQIMRIVVNPPTLLPKLLDWLQCNGYVAYKVGEGMGFLSHVAAPEEAVEITFCLRAWLLRHPGCDARVIAGPAGPWSAAGVA
jgi:hypothetical protein